MKLTTVAILLSAQAALAQPPEGCPEPDRTEMRVDELLFLEALEANGRGEPKEAVKNFWRLIKAHPISRHTPVAWLQLGEHFLSVRKTKQALKCYQKALETRRPLVEAVATIRLASLGKPVDGEAARKRCQ